MKIHPMYIHWNDLICVLKTKSAAGYMANVVEIGNQDTVIIDNKKWLHVSPISIWTSHWHCDFTILPIPSLQNWVWSCEIYRTYSAGSKLHREVIQIVRIIIAFPQNNFFQEPALIMATSFPSKSHSLEQVPCR